MARDTWLRELAVVAMETTLEGPKPEAAGPSQDMEQPMQAVDAGMRMADSGMVAELDDMGILRTAAKATGVAIKLSAMAQAPALPLTAPLGLAKIAFKLGEKRKAELEEKEAYAPKRPRLG